MSRVQFAVEKRLPVAFLLTDELFALSVGKKSYDFAYLMGAGLCFYLAWIGFTAAGVVLQPRYPIWLTTI